MTRCHEEDTGAYDPEMSCTGLPSRTNRSFSMVKVLLPAAAGPSRESNAHSPAARATDALQIKALCFIGDRTV